MTTTATRPATGQTSKPSVDLTAQRAEVEAMIKLFNETKEQIKALNGVKGLAEGRLRELLGDADQGTLDGTVRVSLSHRNRSNIDREKLLEAFPEAHEACLTETQYTVLNTK